MKQIPDRPIPEDVKFANAGIWLAQSLLMPSNEPTPDSLVGYIRAEEARDKKAAVNTFAAKAQCQRRHRVLRSLSKRTGGTSLSFPKSTTWRTRCQKKRKRRFRHGLEPPRKNKRLIPRGPESRSVSVLSGPIFGQTMASENQSF